MGGKFAPFVLAFVESEQPHETRMVKLQEMDAGEPNIYWQKARLRFDRLVLAYAGYTKRFGDKPWRENQTVAELTDEDVPAILWEK